MARPGSAHVSLRDIAREAGVTVPTVSRILNEQTKGFSVKPAVRQRVLHAAKKLNYRPNVLAQSLRKERMGIVGLLNFETSLQYLTVVISGLLDALSVKDIELCSSYAAVPHPVQRLPQWRIDGAVVVSALSAEELVPVRAAGIPFVSLNGHADEDTLAVLMDDEGGTRQAMAYLLGLGHRRIAYANVDGPWVTHSSVALRHDTYAVAMREAGLAPFPLHDQFMPESPDEMVRTLVREHRATAIVTYHNFYAVSVLQSLTRLGIHVPEDVSMLSLHDSYPLEFVFPEVTAVSLPFRDAGRLSAQMLVDVFENRRDLDRRVTLPEHLVVRKSTAAPRG